MQMTRQEIPEVRPDERTAPGGKPIRNRLLLKLPDDEFQVIRPHLEFIDMPHHLQPAPAASEAPVCAFSE